MWGNHSVVNNHLLPLSFLTIHTSDVRRKVCNSRRPDTPRVRAQVLKSKVGGFPPRRISLVFTTFTDRLQHLHMKRIEEYFSNTTDTLWLSGSHWTGTTLAMTLIDRSPSKDTKSSRSSYPSDDEKHNTIQWKPRHKCYIMNSLFKLVCWRELEKSVCENTRQGSQTKQ